MKKYTVAELNDIIKKHEMWLKNDKDGVRADLSYANLRSANLRSADLSSADLNSANLRSADLDKKIISISRIGSRKGMTTYNFDDDIIWCGCFKGTLKEFEDKVKETHKDNKQYLKEYMGFIKYIKSLSEVEK